MDPITGAALVSGGASLLGGIFANNSAKKAAKRQEQFQERMANTAHQREVIDLKAAGLNPMLSALKNGSATPQGSSYQPQEVVTPALNSAKTAMDTRNARAQYDLLNSQTVANDATAAKATADAGLAAAQTAQVQASTAGTEFKNRGFDVLNHFLEPAAELIKGNNSAKTLTPPWIGKGPEPKFQGTSAKSKTPAQRANDWIDNKFPHMKGLSHGIPKK